MTKTPKKRYSEKKTLAVEGAWAIENTLLEALSRAKVLMLFFLVGMIVIVGFAFWRQLVQADFWISYGERNYLRSEENPGKRGTIFDRNNELLAISQPYAMIEAEPIQFQRAIRKYKPDDFVHLNARLNRLAKGIGMLPETLNTELSSGKSYVVLGQDIQPQIAEALLIEHIPAIRYKMYQKRIYPTGEAGAQLVGLTGDVKDKNTGAWLRNKGIDGLELVYDQKLYAQDGLTQSIRDANGKILQRSEVQPPKDGEAITISIDSRIQQYAYTALRDTVVHTKAKDAALVMMDTVSGEIVAMAGYPAFDPNSREGFSPMNTRNIAVTDIFEPGSTIKPFFAALAIENKLVTPHQLIDLQGGKITISGHTIKDSHSFSSAKVSVRDVIAYSSNIGIIKIADQLSKKEEWEMLTKVGLGQALPLGLPGLASGKLLDYRRWQSLDKASVTFGHSLSSSLLQLVRAYTVFTREGELIQPTLQKTDSRAKGRMVFSRSTTEQLNQMLEAVVKEGSGKFAQIPGYRVAGKTGTARKFVNGEYAKKYISTFVGYAPVSQPRLLMAVMINEPSSEGERYYGGAVAAPVFSQVMGHALRLLDIKPDLAVQKAINGETVARR